MLIGAPLYSIRMVLRNNGPFFVMKCILKLPKCSPPQQAIPRLNVISCKNDKNLVACIILLKLYTHYYNGYHR